MSQTRVAPALTAEEQQVFRRDVRRFVESEIVPHVNEWEKDERVPRALWRRLGDLGYLGLETPDEYGGSQSSFTSTLIFMEELSRCGSMGVVAGVAVHTDMSSPYIMRLGTPEQRRRYLPSFVSGERICAVAISEPGAGSDVAGVKTRATRHGDSYVLNGSKTFITNGVYGDVFVVVARTGDGRPGSRHEGISLFVVEKGTTGFSVSKKLEKIGWWASDTAELAFVDCEIPAANLLGGEGAGFRELMTNLQRERLLLGVIGYAGAGRILERSVEYARDRKVFDRPLAELQTIRHRLAEMATAVETARRFVHSLVPEFEAGTASDSVVSMSKIVACDAASLVADSAVQIFGGYGCMRESGIERFYRDVRILPIGGGSSEILKEIIAKRILSASPR